MTTVKPGIDMINCINLKKDIESSIDIAIHMLKKNEVIAFPTDTIYGILGAFNSKTIEKINSIKNRPFGKSYLCLLNKNYDLKQLVDVAQLQKSHIEFIQNNSPGRNTFILPKKKDLFYPRKDTIAIRYPSQEDSIYLYTLLERYRHPIVAPSLNISGQEVVENYKDIPQQIKNKLASIFYLENYRNKQPSTIWNLTQEKIIQIR